MTKIVFDFFPVNVKDCFRVSKNFSFLVNRCVGLINKISPNQEEVLTLKAGIFCGSEISK